MSSTSVESSNDSSGVQNSAQQSLSTESSEEESEVSSKTKAARVICCNIMHQLNCNSANQSAATARPNNIQVSGTDHAPNQGRHLKLPREDLQHLRPAWEWATENHCPAQEIRGDIDESNIVTTCCCPISQMSGGLDEQPDVVNLVKLVPVPQAMSSKHKQPW